MVGRRITTKVEQAKESSDAIGFGAKLWPIADKLRNNMDAAEYNHVVPANPPFNDSDTALRDSEFIRCQAKTSGRERSEGGFPQGRRCALAVSRPAILLPISQGEMQ